MASAVRTPSTSLRARAYDSFQQQIVQANIRPGQFISQRELMQLLGMPLGAVRELIPRLEAEGLLRTVPQRGLQIAHVDLKLINNAFQLRLLLEREAAVRFTATVSDADLAAIADAHLRIVRRARSATIDDDLLSDATTVDWGLHDMMIDALGNELISDVYRINSLRVRLIKLEAGTLETRPIAGTRSRGKTDKEDASLSLDLLLSKKERAEHIMLVDLERNDLGKVAVPGSVRVDELMTIENYSHVKHIVSNVKGSLLRGKTAVDVLAALFPGGTITGTPKIRSMEIIDELEPVARGPYTGSLGYFSFTGNLDFNIIIRSLLVKDGFGFLHTGAGIVADSKAQKEYEETLYKAEGMLSAIYGKKRAHRLLFKR